MLRAASSVVASNRNGAERKKAEAVLAMLKESGNGAGPVILRHLGGVPWENMTENERAAIKRTLARLRPALQAAGMMPCDPRPEDDEPGEDGEA